MPITTKNESQDWWKSKLTNTETSSVQKAFVDYIIEEGLTQSELGDNIDQAKDVLEYIAEKDEKWAKVKARHFKVKQYPAFADFYNAIRNLVNSKAKLKDLLCERNYPFVKKNDADISGKISEDEAEVPSKKKNASHTPAAPQQQIISKSSKVQKNEDEANDLGLQQILGQKRENPSKDDDVQPRKLTTQAVLFT